MHRHGRVVTLRGLPVARWHRGVQCCPRIFRVERRANGEASSVMARERSLLLKAGAVRDLDGCGARVEVGWQSAVAVVGGPVQDASRLVWVAQHRRWP
jgi:hypothetical protein